MTPNMLRQIWSIVEDTHAQVLLKLDDDNLANWLLEKFSDRRPLTPQEATVVNDYLLNRVSLIRDLAAQR